MELIKDIYMKRLSMPKVARGSEKQKPTCSENMFDEDSENKHDLDHELKINNKN